jgi:hypothetical protein
MANTFNNKITTSVGTAQTEVYATDANTKATVIGINVSNNTTGTIVVDIVIEDALATQANIVKGVRIPSGTALAAIGGDQKLVMVENNRLLVQSDTAASSDVTVSILEITP